jgi:hypothetical protein
LSKETAGIVVGSGEAEGLVTGCVAAGVLGPGVGVDVRVGG